jgi:hypothetical protein
MRGGLAFPFWQFGMGAARETHGQVGVRLSKIKRYLLDNASLLRISGAERAVNRKRC